MSRRPRGARALRVNEEDEMELLVIALILLINVGLWWKLAAQDRTGLEHLSRYICRPALAKARLERRSDGMVVLNMKRTWSDGTSAMVFTPAETDAEVLVRTVQAGWSCAPWSFTHPPPPEFFVV